jgi:hypothetical protein
MSMSSSNESENWLLLLSSNFKKEYISDIIEVMGVPSNFIIHFRYKKKWVDPHLWDKLPLKEKFDNNNVLKAFKVLIIYLYQQDITKLIWTTAYPIRFAAVDNCYKTGDSEYDIAHFYLSVDDYCAVQPQTKDRNLLSEIGALQTGETKRFASIHRSLPLDIAKSAEISKTPRESAFYQLVKSIELNHLTSIQDSQKYYPVFHFISGFREISSSQMLKFQKYYKLTEGKEYILETSIQLSEQPKSGSNIKLCCYEKRFENKQELTSLVSTYYDEFLWRLVPSSVIGERKTSITLITDIKPPSQDFEVLNITIDLPVSVCSNNTFKFVDTVGETSLLVATSTIAYLSFEKTFQPQVKLPEWPAYIIAFAYLIGICTKVYLRWLGK